MEKNIKDDISSNDKSSNNPNTIILGLGLATIIPSQSNTEAAIKVADVDGVTIAGVILDAQYSSENMIVIGTKGCDTDHSSNPIIKLCLFIVIMSLETISGFGEQIMVMESVGI